MLQVPVQGRYNGFLIALLLGVNNFTDCCALTTTILNRRVPRSFTAVVGTSIIVVLCCLTTHDVCCDVIVFSSEIACDTELKQECKAVYNEALFRTQMRES